MKKYSAPLALFLFVFCNAYAMELDICHFNKLPVDVLNLIEHFLTCDDETDEQFAERIRLEYEEKQREREEKRKEIEKTGIIYEVGHIRILEACNIDRTKFLVFFQNNLCLQDYINPEEECVNTIYDYHERRERHYISIGLSPKGGMFACYYCKRCKCEKFPCEESDMHVLEIIRIATEKKEDKNHILILQESRELYRGKSLDIDGIFFNKQGNKLIAYNSYNDFKPTFFSLKNSDDTQSQETVQTKNNLQEYFRDKLVCQKYIEGKK